MLFATASDAASGRKSLAFMLDRREPPVLPFPPGEWSPSDPSKKSPISDQREREREAVLSSKDNPGIPRVATTSSHKRFRIRKVPQTFFCCVTVDCESKSNSICLQQLRRQCVQIAFLSSHKTSLLRLCSATLDSGRCCWRCSCLPYLH